MRPYTARARHWTNPLSGMYRCADTKLLYLKADGGRDWVPVCAALGLSALVDDARFDTPAKRTQNSKSLYAAVQEVFLTAGRDEWLRKLEEDSLICAAVQSIEEVLDDPQVGPPPAIPLPLPVLAVAVRKSALTRVDRMHGAGRTSLGGHPSRRRWRARWISTARWRRRVRQWPSLASTPSRCCGRPG